MDVNPAIHYDLNGFYIEILSNCNLRCLHCYNESGESNNRIPFDVFKRCIDEFDDSDTAIHISGGEPLLHPEIWKFVEYLGNKNWGSSLLVTNATMVDKDAAKKLVKADIGVQVSLNGDKEAHENLCGIGTYEKTMSGIKNLVEAGHRNVIIRCTINRKNYKNIIDFISFAASLTGQVLLGFLTEDGRGLTNSNQFSISLNDKEALIQELENSDIVSKLKENCKIGWPDQSFNYGCPMIHPPAEGEKIPFNSRIDSLGNVYLCQGFVDATYSLGNIYENSLNEILVSERMKKFVNFLNTGINYIHSCNACVWKYNCGKGCVARAVAKGSVQDNDGECYLRRQKMGENLILDTLNSK